MKVRVLSWAPFLSSLFFLSSAHAVFTDFHVSQITSPRTVKIAPDQPRPCPDDLLPNSRLIIISRIEGKPVGYGLVKTVDRAGVSCEAILEVKIHEKSLLVMEGDQVVFEDLRDGISIFPGRIDLLIRDEKKYSSRYKQLAYFGPFLGDGLALDEGEFLVDPLAYVQYGVSSAFTLETVMSLDVVGVPNLGFKYEGYNYENWVVTTGALLGHNISENDTYLRVAGTLTIPSNGRFQSHTQIVYFFRPQDGLSNSLTDPQLTALSEIIMSNWDRLLFGPLYNFELKSVGAFLSYVYIWNRLHLTLGVQTQDLTNFRLDQRDAYTPTFGIWWRL